MTPSEILSVAWRSIHLVLLLSAPAVLAAAVVGLVVSVLQAATQVQEQTLSIAPKIVAVYVALAITGGWLLAELVAFARSVFGSIAAV